VPMIGSAAMKLPTGRSPRCRKGERSTATAMPTAAAQPMT